MIIIEFPKSRFAMFAAKKVNAEIVRTIEENERERMDSTDRLYTNCYVELRFQDPDQRNRFFKKENDSRLVTNYPWMANNDAEKAELTVPPES